MKPTPLALAIALTTGSAVSSAQMLEEVIVTAQKRSESMQEVAVSITAVDGDVLQAMGMRNTNDLAEITPNLSMQSDRPGSSFPIIRGIGTPIAGPGVDQGVAIYLDGVQVSTCYTNHPSLTLGYRLEAGGASVVYIPDHEPHSLHPMNSPVGAFPVHHEDQDHIRFIEDADLLIHDAQYTLDEYTDKIGWGHSPFEKVVDYAVAARVKRLALFHHDPLRDDDALEILVEAARKRAASRLNSSWAQPKRPRASSWRWSSSRNESRWWVSPAA